MRNFGEGGERSVPGPETRARALARWRLPRTLGHGRECEKFERCGLGSSHRYPSHSIFLADLTLFLMQIRWQLQKVTMRLFGAGSGPACRHRDLS
jgi:hypothetical protein